MTQVLSTAPGAALAIGEDSGVFDTMATTRSIRRLRPDPVPDDVLRRVVEAATWAPSARNRQSCEFVVVTDRAQMAKVARVWRECVHLYDATSCLSLEDCVGTSGARSIRDLAEHLDDVPAVVAVCHPVSPRHDPYPPGAARSALRLLGGRRVLRLNRRMSQIVLLRDAASAYPAVQNLLLACRALGLGASFFMLHLFLEEELKAALGVPRDVRLMALVAIGWPWGHFGPVRRRPVSEVLHRDRW